MQADDFVTNIEAKFQSEIVPIYKEQEEAKAAFVHKFWPNATPLQVSVAAIVAGLVLGKLISGYQANIETGLDELAKVIAPWGLDHRKQTRKRRRR